MEPYMHYNTISLLLILTLETDRSGPWTIANHPVKVVVPPVTAHTQLEEISLLLF